MMHGTVQRWGRSHGIRIPEGAVQTAGLKENDEVEIIADTAQIIIRKAQELDRLDALFIGYDGSYRSSEMNSGEPAGREVFE